MKALEKEISESWYGLGKSMSDAFGYLPDAIRAVANRVKEAEAHQNVADYNTGFEAGRKHGDLTAKLIGIDRDRLTKEVERLNEEVDAMLNATRTERAEQAEAEVTRLTAQWDDLKTWNFACGERASGTNTDIAHGIELAHAAVNERMAELEAQR